MKSITLEGNQRENLCYELARLVKQYEIFDNVECIYAIPYESDYSSNFQLSVVIVRRMTGERYLENHIDYYNDRTKKRRDHFVDEYGVDLFLSYDDASNYRSTKYQMSREGYLLNGLILFDRDGFYTQLKENEEKDDSLAFLNSCDFFPPLNDGEEPIGLQKDEEGRKLVFVNKKSNKE